MYKISLCLSPIHARLNSKCSDILSLARAALAAVYGLVKDALAGL
jgi:hypothetical protein